MKKPDLAVIYEEGISNDQLTEFRDAVAASGLDIIVESRPAAGPYAGMEWFIPTAIVVFIAKSYFDSFLKEAGKDHYQLLKSKLSRATSKTMQSSRIEPVLFGSSGKLRENSRYSLAISIYAEANDGNTFKLLLPKTSYQPDYEQIISSFLNFLNDYHAGVKALEDIGVDARLMLPSRTILVHMDEESKQIEWVDHRH
ncbi:hypothetical protein [Vreelandella boliviensis]|uniref:hypothetical protein n=1 Tax=Vreelandella boliviensis TaxID=223527 RepID=UPI001B8B3B57|nr:hypothetical protein [Halomonas boliviensis]MBS3668555.1 hypothetical protein [Halomonas boliviensis]